MKLIELEVHSDLSERILYNSALPMYIGQDELRFFKGFAPACHWHPDLELMVIIDGEMDFYVNGERVSLKEGEGIFVNSKRLHYFASAKELNCVYIVAVIHPSLLGSDLHDGKKNFDTLFGFSKEDYLFLSPEIEWQKEVMYKIIRLCNVVAKQNYNPLRLISKVNSICADISDNIKTNIHQQKDEDLWFIVCNMTGFIQKNFAGKISLNEIAAAGSVCRTQCCKLFSKYTNQTPTAFLTQYRISKSCEMLTESKMSITEIAMACGFQSPSYFTQVFHEKLGLTPKAYRSQSVLMLRSPGVLDS